MMQIHVADWACADNLKNTPYYNPNGNGKVLTYDKDIIKSIDELAEEALSIARDLFLSGLNVMIKRVKRRNIGTKKKPVWTEESIIIFVDNLNFRTR